MVAAASLAFRAASLLLLVLMSIAATGSNAFHPLATAIATKTTTTAATTTISLLSIRGGTDDDDDDDDVDESEYDSDDESKTQMETQTQTLASSTKSTLLKKQATDAKAKVALAMSMSSSKPGAKSSAGLGRYYKKYVPYIIRACLNPFTFVKMTKAYFASLIDVNYLKEEPSQALRSALEQKARRQSPSTGGAQNKPKRKMKPGQAKTLSDLPQLSA